MTKAVNRRRFVKAAGSALPLGQPSTARAAKPVSRYKKAMCFAMIQGKGSAEEKLRMAKDAGFDGVEVDAQRFTRCCRSR